MYSVLNVDVIIDTCVYSGLNVDVILEMCVYSVLNVDVIIDTCVYSGLYVDVIIDTCVYPVLYVCPQWSGIAKTEDGVEVALPLERKRPIPDWMVQLAKSPGNRILVEPSFKLFVLPF